MPRVQKSTTLYPHPFSRAYWRDAAAEMKDVRMMVVTALMIALRIALKPVRIYLGPQLYVPVSMLAAALGAMIYGPVVAIPSAIISDTLGFLVFPDGSYFLPYVLTEISSTLIYALFLYRAKVTPTRVMLSRFCICLFVNVIMQQFINSWYYTWIGSPEQARAQILGIMTVSRIFKNLCMFPIESVVITLVLKFLLPICRRAGVTYCGNADMKFTKRQVATLICLLAVGIASATGYMAYRYSNTSRSTDYSTEERMEANQEMTALVLEETDDWDDQTVVCIVDSAYRGLFAAETDYTVSVYVLDEEAFAAGQAADSGYNMDTLWAYSKSGPSKDAYQSLVKVAEAAVVKNEKTGEVLSFTLTLVESDQ